MLTRIDGRIAPRSGLAAKHFIDTGAGVIDADYRGEVKVLLFNHSDVDFPVKAGDRVAQLVLERVSLFLDLEVESIVITDRSDLHTGSERRRRVGGECPWSRWIRQHWRLSQTKIDLVMISMRSQ
jgi:deoxyuridine 5'-triphosphate nucleotidohydrolase